MAIAWLTALNILGKSTVRSSSAGIVSIMHALLELRAKFVCFRRRGVEEEGNGGYNYRRCRRIVERR